MSGGVDLAATLYAVYPQQNPETARQGELFL